MGMLAENKKELSLRKGGRGKIAEKMRNMGNKKSAGKARSSENGWRSMEKTRKGGRSVVF